MLRIDQPIVYVIDDNAEDQKAISAFVNSMRFQTVADLIRFAIRVEDLERSQPPEAPHFRVWQTN